MRYGDKSTGNPMTKSRSRYISFNSIFKAFYRGDYVKRCPNGWRRNPDTDVCEPISSKGETQTGCHEGYHKHQGLNDCHPITQVHRKGSGTCNQHRLLGIPCGYEGEELDKDGRPVEPGIPTRKWNEMKRKEKNKKKDEKKDEKKDDGKGKGSSEPHVFVTSTSFMLEDVCSSLDGYDDMVSSVVNKLKSKTQHDDYIAHIRDVFKDIPWVENPDFKGKHYLLNGYSDSQINDAINYVFKNCNTDIAKTIEKYPIGLLRFSGFMDYKKGTKSRMSTAIMSTYIRSGEVIIGLPLILRGMIDLGYMKEEDVFERKISDISEYEIKIDPVTGERTKWSFHVHSSSVFDSFSHEWGHLMLDTYARLKGNGKMPETDESFKKRNDPWSKIVKEFEEDVLTTFPEGVSTVYSDWSLGGGVIEMILKLPPDVDTKQIKNKTMRDFAKAHGFKLSLKKDKYYGTYTLKLTTEDNANTPWHWSKIERETTNHLDIVNGNASELRSRVKDGNPSNVVITNLGKEVEELYKEIYNVDKIVPSDVYSGYAYLGTGWDRDSEEVPLAKITEATMHERVAEAFSDVAVRGKKANSMSNLLVSAVQYYISATMTGNNESFTDYFRRTFSKEDIGERIIKHKYINYRTIHGYR